MAQPANDDIKTNSGRRAPLKGMVGIAGGRAPRSTKEAGAVKEPRYRASSESVSRTVDESTGAGPPPRDQLEQHPATVLKDEGPGAPRVVRYDLPGGPVVLKEWQPAGSVIFRWWVRSIMRREIQNYRLLQDTGAIPRYLGQYGPTAFLMEWVDGLQLRRRLPQELKDLAVDGLERSLGILHERKFVHLDLHQRLNTLVSKQGQVWLVDLGQGIDCSRGPVRRLLFPFLDNNFHYISSKSGTLACKIWQVLEPASFRNQLWPCKKKCSAVQFGLGVYKRKKVTTKDLFWGDRQCRNMGKKGGKSKLSKG